MTISNKTTKMLWGRAAGRCSISTCRKQLVLDETTTDTAAVIGEMCHIVAETEDGPRGQSPLPLDERNDYVNLILLCGDHHTEIDKQVATYPIERLQAIKAKHERWVRERLPGYDARGQRQDEIYAGYIDEWARRCDLDGWTGWGGAMLSGGQPQMTIEQAKQLEDLGPWLLSRIWPGRYPALERAFLNFRLVLQDLRRIFSEHAEKPWPNAHRYLTKRFYKIPEWDEERYHRLVDCYNHHVELVQDLMLELTRAANLICEEIRACILPGFRIDKGHILLESGPMEEDFSW